MEPMVRIELTTDGLRNRCSTAELHWLKPLKINHFRRFLHRLWGCLHAQFVSGVFSSHENNILTNRAQNEFVLNQNTVSTPHPLQTQQEIFWVWLCQWQVNSPFRFFRTAAGAPDSDSARGSLFAEHASPKPGAPKRCCLVHQPASFRIARFAAGVIMPA